MELLRFDTMPGFVPRSFDHKDYALANWTRDLTNVIHIICKAYMHANCSTGLWNNNYLIKNEYNQQGFRLFFL